MEIKHLEVLVMPNSEILCEGKTVGFTTKLGKYLHPVESKPLSSTALDTIADALIGYYDEVRDRNGNEDTLQLLKDIEATQEELKKL